MGGYGCEREWEKMGNDITINKQKRWESNMGDIRGNKDKW